MRRNRRQEEKDDALWNAIFGTVVLLGLYLIYLFYTNKAQFWRWVIYGLVGLVLLLGSIVGIKKLKTAAKQRELLKLLGAIRNAGAEEEVHNFINRFGFNQEKGDAWRYRNYSFLWYRFNDLQKILAERNIKLSVKELSQVLKYYIDEKEEGLTFASIQGATQKFASLNGPTFEKLLYRLYEKMDYSVQLNGRSGDQGADLIANKNGERIVIQAKCYRDWSVGNSAVQEVVAAKTHYDCTKAMVITTSYFTNEAIQLARTNNVELISKKELRELLLKNLEESWE